MNWSASVVSCQSVMLRQIAFKCACLPLALPYLLSFNSFCSSRSMLYYPIEVLFVPGCSPQLDFLRKLCRTCNLLCFGVFASSQFFFSLVPCFKIKRWQNVFCRLWRKQMILRLSKCRKGVDRLSVTFLKNCFSSFQVWSFVRLRVRVNGRDRLFHDSSSNLPACQLIKFDIVPLGMGAVCIQLPDQIES